MFWYGISRIWNLQMTVRHWHRRSGRALQRRRLREGREVWKGFPEHQEVRSGNKNTDIVNHLLLMDKCCKTSWYWKYTCRCIYTVKFQCIAMWPLLLMQYIVVQWYNRYHIEDRIPSCFTQVWSFLRWPIRPWAFGSKGRSVTAFVFWQYVCIHMYSCIYK